MSVYRCVHTPLTVCRLSCVTWQTLLVLTPQLRRFICFFKLNWLIEHGWSNLFTIQSLSPALRHHPSLCYPLRIYVVLKVTYHRPTGLPSAQRAVILCTQWSKAGLLPPHGRHFALIKCKIGYEERTYGNEVTASILTRRFYRATRMHSANYAVARCLSVCLSVTRRYSVETVIHGTE